jgi:hypothetical protein
MLLPFAMHLQAQLGEQVKSVRSRKKPGRKFQVHVSLRPEDIKHPADLAASMRRAAESWLAEVRAAGVPPATGWSVLPEVDVRATQDSWCVVVYGVVAA